ncbi:MAG: hypothetical protein WKF84_27135 [Pyrinomonadaceae bacterium]
METQPASTNGATRRKRKSGSLTADAAPLFADSDENELKDEATER